MSAQDKLGFGMLLFLVFFLIAFLLVPSDVYRNYLASLRQQGKRRLIRVLGAGVFMLSIPYFYEVLVGFDNRGTARVIQIVISASAYLVLIDVIRFVYKAYWAPSLIRRRPK